MKAIGTTALTAAFLMAATVAHADRKEDVFYILLDNMPDNPILDHDLQMPLLEMMLLDATNRGLGLADVLILRAERSIGAWNTEIPTSRSQPPESLRDLLAEKLTQIPEGPGGSGLMRLLQTTRVDCSQAETVTVYLLSNLASSVTLNAETGYNLETAPSISLSGCNLVWVGPTLGSPNLGLREVQHIDAFVTDLSDHMGADSYVILR